MHLTEYAIFGGLILFALIFAAIPLLISYVIAPKAPGKIKNSIYECGMRLFSDSRIQFDVKYYLYALLFVIFDVEAVFLFPWAVAFHQLGLYGLIEAIIFIAILFLGLLYAWKKKALTWE